MTNGQFKIHPTHTKYIVLGIVAVLVIILLFTVFKSFRKTEINTHEELIKSKDANIRSEQKVVEAYKIIVDEKEKNIIELKQRDSISNVNYLKNQQVYKRLDEKIKTIPDYIARIADNNDSIIAAFKRHSTDTP
jgi:hypothetical protein